MSSKRSRRRSKQVEEADWSTFPADYKQPKSIPNCPEGVDELEWIASETIGFFNSLSLLVGFVIHDLKRQYKQPGEGFPEGFAFLWVDDDSDEGQNVSSPEYISNCLEWMNAQFSDTQVFPTDVATPFPKEFVVLYISKMFTMMFRIYSILHSKAFDVLRQKGMLELFNASMKHFVFFGIRHSLLVETTEFLALRGPMRRLQEQYIKVVSEE